jgi:hypothetical protein
MGTFLNYWHLYIVYLILMINVDQLHNFTTKPKTRQMYVVGQ